MMGADIILATIHSNVEKQQVLSAQAMGWLRAADEAGRAALTLRTGMA